MFKKKKKIASSTSEEKSLIITELAYSVTPSLAKLHTHSLSLNQSVNV